MQSLDTIHDYLRSHSDEIGERILSSYPALHGADEAPSPLLSGMVRAPYPAQTLAIMGASKRWQFARNANVVAECGAGKTLIALGSMLVHSAGRPFSGLVMAPPHLVEKWARETFLTLPHVRVFLIDDMRNGGESADSVWKSVQQLRPSAFPTAEDGALIAATDSEASGVPETSLPDFGLRKDRDIPGRCVAEHRDVEQLSLF